MFRVLLHRFILCLLLIGLASTNSFADTEHNSGTTIGYRESLVLGLVEGITEYLPISSTGHLILTNEVLGLNEAVPLTEAYTLKEAAFAYIIILQAGAILAVLFLYRKTFWEILRGFMGNCPNGRRLGILLALAFTPAAILGLLLNDWIESLLGDNLIAVASALLLGGIAMLLVERRYAKEWKKEGGDRETRILAHLSYKEAFSIGCCQCLALWPGMSRSMVTILGGYWVGLSPSKAAEFSFLLGFITLSAASGYKLFTDGSALLMTMKLGPLLLGIFIAFLSAIIAIRLLVACLTKYGLSPFAWYRFALAMIIFAFAINA